MYLFDLLFEFQVGGELAQKNNMGEVDQPSH